MTDENSGKDKDGKVWATVLREDYEEYTVRAGKHPSKQAKAAYYQEVYGDIRQYVKVSGEDYDKISNRDSLPEIWLDEDALRFTGYTRSQVLRCTINNPELPGNSTLVLEKDKQLGKEHKDTH